MSTTERISETPPREVPSTWRQALRIAGNDLRRRVRDRSLLIQGVIAPVALGLIVGLAFGGGFSFSATIGVADADGSRASGQVVDALVAGSPTADGGQDDSAPSLVFEPVDAAEAGDLVEDGTVDAAIVLPEGLGAAAGEPPPFGVIGHPARPLATSVAEAVADSVAAQGGSSRLAVATAQAVDGQRPGQVDVEAVAEAAAATGSPLQVEPTDVSSSFSVIGYFAPAMAMLFLFFTLGAGARSVVTERREGTLARIRAAPVTGNAVLVGKTLAVLVQGLLSVLTVWAVTSVVFRVNWGDPAGVAAVLVAVVVSIAGVTLMITGLARTENQADALTTVVALTLAVIGGTFFFGAAGVVAVLKPFTPNGRAMLALTELSAGEAGLADVVATVGVLLLIGLVTGAVGLAGLRRRVVL